MKTILFDTETTGLTIPRIAASGKQPHVIEFYACRVDETTWEIEAELDLLIKPPIPLSPEITKITGLTNDDLAHAATFAEHEHTIKAFLENGDRVVAHNASFDRDIIDYEMSRVNSSVNWPPLVCTVEQTQHLKSMRLKLSALYEMLFNEPFTGAHRAKVDVMALLRCYAELRKLGEI